MRRESLARSGGLSLFGSAFAALSALALTALIGNGFGPAGTGVFFQAVAVFTVVSQVLRLGSNSSIIRFISAQRALVGIDDSWRISLLAIVPVAVIATGVGILMAVFASPLGHFLAPAENATELARIIASMAPFVVVGAVLSVLQTITRMVRGVGAFTLLQSILLPLSRLAVAIAVLTLALGADTAFFGWMAVLPLWLVVTVAVVAQPLNRDRIAAGAVHPRDRTSMSEFFSFSAPRAVGASLETALDWSDVLVVAALTTPAQAGVYAVATRAVRAGQIVDRAMRIAVSPTISKLLAQRKLDDARRLHTAVTRFMILASWPFYLTLAVMGPAVLSLFGDGFEDGWIVLALLSGAMMVSSAAGMLQSVLLQGGRSSWQMYNKAVVLVVNVGLNLFLVPLLGITGAAISWVVSLSVDTTLAAWQVHRGMGVRLEPRSLLGATVLPLLVFGVGNAVVRLIAGATLPGLLIGLPVLVVLYAGLVWLLRTRLGIDSVLDRFLPARFTRIFAGRVFASRVPARHGRGAKQQSERPSEPAPTAGDR